jgi:LacI family transcriptional regulator
VSGRSPRDGPARSREGRAVARREAVEEDRRSSLTDVARLAGVSVSTASRALRHSGIHLVAAATRRRVEAAAKELGYRPNPLARGLRARRMDTFAIMVHDVADPYFAEIVRAATSAASEAGYLTVVCSSDRDPDTELRYMDLLIDHRVAAVLFAGGGLEDRAYQRAMSHRIAAIRAYGGAVVALAPRVERWPTEVTDNRGGARLMTEYLIGLGHRKIAFITGPANVHTSIERWRGHREAMLAAGLEPVMEQGDFRPEEGAAATRRLLERTPGFTALFVASDTMAVGALAELRRQGLRVPEDVSVAGFGDVPGWEFRDPPLTTIRSNLGAIGEAGVRRAMSQLNGTDKPPRVRVHPVELVVRGSTRPLERAQDEGAP